MSNILFIDAVLFMIVDLSFKKMFVSLIALSFLMGTPESVLAGGGNNNQGKKEKRAGADRTARMPFRFPNQEVTPPVPVAPLLSVETLTQLLASSQPFDAPFMPILPKIQHLVPLTQTKLFALAADAHNADIEAQDQLVQRNYWALLNMEYPVSGSWRSLLCNPLMHNQEISPISWKDIEERALQDPQYAYTLINAYGGLLDKRRGNPNILSSYPTFLEKFLGLRQSLQIKAEAGDPDSQFNLGLLYFHSRWFPQHAGLALKSDQMNELTSQWLIKAATRGHTHAQIILGASSCMGYSPTDNNVGRNPVDALRWLLPSKDNKTSKKLLSSILSKSSKIAEVEGTFHEEIAGIERLLERVRGQHIGQVELHNPDGNYSEHKFAIPELSELYKKIVATEEEVRELLISLKQSSPGLMMNSVHISGFNKEQINRLIARQPQPHFVSMNEINGVQYLTLDEKNVALLTPFLAYVNNIDEKFKEAEKTLKKIGKRYKLVLETASGELMTRRLLGLKTRMRHRLNCLRNRKNMLKNSNPL